MPNKYLDQTGLQTYHKGVVDALSKKENKHHIGDSIPSEKIVDAWIDTGEEQSTNEVRNGTYKVHNGTDWDAIHFKTSATQVDESNGTLNFLRPLTHTVNGKSFWNGTAHQGITLYSSDIRMSVNDNTTLSTKITAINNAVNDLDDVIDLINKDVTTQLSNCAKLDSNGKIELEHIPDSILGQVNYSGLFDVNANEVTIANTNTGESTSLTMKLPTKSEITAGVDENTYYIPLIGDYFIVTTNGSFDSLALVVGDWLIYNGTTSGWGKVDNTDAVSSVAGLTGAITASNLVSKLKGTTSTTLAAGNHSHSEYLPKAGGDVTGDINMPDMKGLTNNNGSKIGFSDDGLPCIVGPGERRLNVAIDDLDGDYFGYIFPEKSGTIALLDDIPSNTGSSSSTLFTILNRITLSRNGYVNLLEYMQSYNELMIVVRSVVGAATSIGLSSTTTATSSNFLCSVSVTGTKYTKILINKTNEGYVACQVGTEFGWNTINSYPILRNYCATSNASVTMSVVIHGR